MHLALCTTIGHFFVISAGPWAPVGFTAVPVIFNLGFVVWWVYWTICYSRMMDEVYETGCIVCVHRWVFRCYSECFKHTHTIYLQPICDRFNPCQTFNVPLLFCFRNLLTNVDLISGRVGHLSGSLETMWQTAAPLVADVRSELINVPPAQITDACKSSPLISFVQLEARTVSQQTEFISAFIDDLEQVLAGRSAAHPTACDSLKAIASHRMPQLARPVQNVSSSSQDLTEWIRDLQQRLIKLPRGNVENNVFQLSVFSRPEGFLHAALRHLARQQFKSLHSAHLTIDLVCCTFCHCFFTCLFCQKKNRFLQRVSIACYAKRCITYRKSVRPSDRLSHAGIKPKRLKLRSWGLHWRIAPWL